MQFSLGKSTMICISLAVFHWFTNGRLKRLLDVGLRVLFAVLHDWCMRLEGFLTRIVGGTEIAHKPMFLELRTLLCYLSEHFC